MKPSSMVLGVMIALAMAVWAPAWGAELKIGVVDSQKVFESAKLGKKAKDTLEEYVRTRQKIVTDYEDDIKKMEDELAKQGAVLSPEAKKDKEEGLRRKFTDYQRRTSQLQQEVQVKRKEILDEFQKNVEQVVRGIADKEKFSLIMDKSENGAVASPVIYSHPSIDLTERVIKELDAKGAK